MTTNERIVQQIADDMGVEVDRLQACDRTQPYIASRSVIVFVLQVIRCAPIKEIYQLVGVGSHTGIHSNMGRARKGLYDDLVPGGDTTQYARTFRDFEHEQEVSVCTK